MLLPLRKPFAQRPWRGAVRRERNALSRAPTSPGRLARYLLAPWRGPITADSSARPQEPPNPESPYKLVQGPLAARARGQFGLVRPSQPRARCRGGGVV